MAIGVTFPENEDVVTFWWKIERLVRVESKVDIYKKELGNYAGYRLRKVYWKDLHYWGMKISRDAVTHVLQDSIIIEKQSTGCTAYCTLATEWPDLQGVLSSCKSKSSCLFHIHLYLFIFMKVKSSWFLYIHPLLFIFMEVKSTIYFAL